MSTLLPAIKKSNDFEIKALANKSNMKLQYFSKKLGASIITTDYLELFKNKDIDLVMAITRHNLHSDLVKSAIEFKKNLFIEKPLCIKEEELNEIKDLIKNTSGLPLINIGFNRRFSKLTLELKKALNNSEKPMIINYAVNSENFDKTMWVNTEEGGGQTLGEGCAMIDLGLYLANSEIESINVNKTKDNSHLETGNFICTIQFKNGSLFNLIYTTFGNKKWPKEVINVFYDGHNYTINDFKELKSSNKKYNLKLKKQDKGHIHEIEELGQSTRKGVALIPLNEIIKATEIAFEINKSINK
jgi:predicted dehydrogenase